MVHIIRNPAGVLSNRFHLDGTFIRSSYLITMVFMFITAFVLAEICSALPLSGSIYIWAAESAGPKYARFFGFLVAWWSTTAWMTFTAGNCQVMAR
jgi:translation initiation factor 5B